MFEVELDIFSGRPNPRWTLDAREEAELVERLLDRTVPYVEPMDTDGYLGYRGFVVRASGATAATLESRGLPTAFRVRDGLGSSIDLGAESWLLDTAIPREVPGHVVELASGGMARPVDPLARCKPYMTSTTDFSDWNGQPWTDDNNCYNYGSNHRTDTFAQPGRGSGDMYDFINVPEILRVSQNDGYVLECDSKKAIHVGFAVIPSGADYHWWRRTQPVGGQPRWCHKPGGTPVRNTDSSGNPITDPSTCNRGAYTTWGYFMFHRGKRNSKVI
jgi:hypothetical protein